MLTLLKMQAASLDSLIRLVDKSKTDTAQVNLLNNIAKDFNLTEKKFEKALAFTNQAIELATKINYKKGLALAYEQQAYAYDWIAYTINGDYSKVIPTYLKALQTYSELKDSSNMANTLYLMAYTLDYQADYANAGKYYYQSLQLYENLKDTSKITRLFFCIGQSNNFQKNYTKAFDYLFKSLSLAKQQKHVPQTAECLMMIGNTHSAIESYDSAAYYLNQALTIRKVNELLKNKLGEIYYNLSIINFKKKNYNASLDYANQAFQYDDINSDTYLQGEINGLMGQCYEQLNDNQKAITFFNKSLDFSRISGSKNITSEQYLNLSRVYEKLGKTPIAFDYYKKHTALKDSVFNENKAKENAQHEMQYNFDKQQLLQQTEQANKDALAKAELNKQKTVRNIFTIAFAIMLLLAFWIFKEYKQKKRITELVSHQYKEIELQKEIMEVKNKEIIDSINYAKRIQNAILPDMEEFEKNFTDAFVLFTPKDIVSGDFYWMYERDNFIFYATADCTGHGVPGGFMSMLSNSLLNEVVIDKQTYEPGDVLDLMRIKIIRALKQQGKVGEQQDGIDIAFCRFDKNNNTLTYAAANNPIWLIRNNTLEEYPCNKQPVGISSGKAVQFDQRTIQLQQGDCVYTFTDGYADQFGGIDGKKYKQKNLKQLIERIHNQPMVEQKKVLAKNFNDWRNNTHEQLDDVCVIGIRI